MCIHTCMKDRARERKRMCMRGCVLSQMCVVTSTRTHKRTHAHNTWFTTANSLWWRFVSRLCVCMYIYKCTYLCTYVYTHTYVCACVTSRWEANAACTYTRVCTSVHMCLRVYIHIHTTREKHQRERSTCKDCGGSGICEHQRRRSRCKDCGGSSLCDPTWLCVFDPFGVVSSLSIRQTFPIDLRPHECRDSMPRPQTVTWCPLDSHLLYFHTYIRNSEVYNMQTEVCRNPDTYKYFPVNLK